MRLDAASGAITRWLYRDPTGRWSAWRAGEGFPLTGREVVLTPPLTEAQMRALKVGDVVLINGEMYTGRDNVHSIPDEEPAAGGSARRRPLSLRSGDAEGGRASGR